MKNNLNYSLATVFSKKDFSFSCIYKMTFPNGKIYVGQAQNMRERFREYRRPRASQYLLHAIQKYGLENIKVEILERDISVEKLDEREQYYFNILEPFYDNGKGYNICKFAGTSRGRKNSSEARLKISEKAKERIGDKNPFFGKKHSEETKEYNRNINIGKKQSEETIRKRIEKSKLKTEETSRKKSITMKLITPLFKVERIDIVTGESIIYESTEEAAIKNGRTKTAITNAIHHTKYETFKPRKGYIFKRVIT